MKIVQAILFAIISSILVTSVSGNEMSDEKCKNPLSSSDIDNCVSRKYQQSELILKSEYSSLIARADKSYSNDVELNQNYRELTWKTHESWLIYRDFSCQLESFEIDTESVAHDTIRKACIEKMNNERIITLRNTLQQLNN